MDTEKIKAIGKCCMTDKPLSTSEQLNFIQLPYKAHWTFPTWGNILTGQKDMALAIVHDDAIANSISDIKYAVEFKGEELIYHPLDTLPREDIVRPKSHSL
jgi:hypothetical protein